MIGAMGAIGYWVRRQRRRHWVGIVVLAVLAGLGLGLTSVALTGARRADTAFDRLQAVTLAPDVGTGIDEGMPEEVIATVAADPAVRHVDPLGRGRRSAPIRWRRPPRSSDSTTPSSMRSTDR